MFQSAGHACVRLFPTAAREASSCSHGNRNVWECIAWQGVLLSWHWQFQIFVKLISFTCAWRFLMAFLDYYFLACRENQSSYSVRLWTTFFQFIMINLNDVWNTVELNSYTLLHIVQFDWQVSSCLPVATRMHRSIHILCTPGNVQVCIVWTCPYE